MKKVFDYQRNYFFWFSLMANVDSFRVLSKHFFFPILRTKSRNGRFLPLKQDSGLCSANRISVMTAVIGLFSLRTISVPLSSATTQTHTAFSCYLLLFVPICPFSPYHRYARCFLSLPVLITFITLPHPLSFPLLFLLFTLVLLFWRLTRKIVLSYGAGWPLRHHLLSSFALICLWLIMSHCKPHTQVQCLISHCLLRLVSMLIKWESDRSFRAQTSLASFENRLWFRRLAPRRVVRLTFPDCLKHSLDFH